MEWAIDRVGLPVTCRKCKAKGFVKPRTDYGGWSRWRALRGPSTWYCPKDIYAQERAVARISGATTPQPELSVEEQLYALI